MENSPTTECREQRLAVDVFLGYEVVSAPNSLSLVPGFFDVFGTKTETDIKSIYFNTDVR